VLPVVTEAAWRGGALLAMTTLAGEQEETAKPSEAAVAKETVMDGSADVDDVVDMF
jgi:hypothetical protein